MHKPLSNGFMLLSIFVIIIGFYLWAETEALPELLPWSFLTLVVGIIMFISSFISAVRAPLDSDNDMLLAAHEAYRGKRYPDTHLVKKKTTPKKTKKKK